MHIKQHFVCLWLPIVGFIKSIRTFLSAYSPFLKCSLSNYLIVFSFIFYSFSFASQEEIKEEERARRVVPSSQQVKDKLWILSIDGGGIRGLIPAYILQYMEERVEYEVREKLRQRVSHDLGYDVSASHFPPCPVYLSHCFDIMAGTSTGGIICLGLNIPQDGEERGLPQPLPKYKAADLVKLYQDKGHIIFSNPSSGFSQYFNTKYNAASVEKIFQEYFGTTKLSQLISTTLVTAYEMRQEQLLVLDSSKAKHFKSEDFYTKDAARSTSAAPTYFSAAEVKNLSGEPYLFADGGLIANNPGLIAYLRGQSLYPKAKRIMLLSLGTGTALEDSLSGLKNKGLLGWAPEVASVMMKGVSDLHHKQKKQQSYILGKEAFDYTRIQIPLTKKRSELDNVAPDNLKYLLQIAKKEADSSKPLRRFIHLLAEDYSKRYNILPISRIHLLSQLKKIEKTTEVGGVIFLKKNYELNALDDLKAWEIVNIIKPSTHLITSFNTEDITVHSKALRYLLRNLPFLKKLSLRKAGISREHIKEIRENAQNLSSLSLIDNIDLGDDGASLITKDYFPHLQYLNLNKINLTDQGAKHIVENFPTLLELHIRINKLTVDGIKMLLTHLKELKDIDYGHNDFKMLPFSKPVFVSKL